jgi:hypothetical protein
MRRFVVLFLVPFLSVFLLACDNNCPDDCRDSFYPVISEESKSVVLINETVDVSADGHKAYKLDAQPCDDNCLDDCRDGFYPVISEESKSVVLINKTVDVSADGHKAYKLDAQRDYYFRIDIVADSDVSVWVMSEDEYSHFKKGESFNYVSSASREKVMRFSYDLKDVYGSYYLVLDDGLHYQSPCWAELRVSMLENDK